MTATPETVSTDDKPHLGLAGLAQQAGYAYRFAKAGQTTEALEHVEAIERLIAAYRTALGVDRVLKRRIYVDGEGDPWIEIPMSPGDGSVAIVQLREDVDVAVDAEEIRTNTGGLCEIGRCA
jgi:hypothetical protein